MAARTGFEPVNRLIELARMGLCSTFVLLSPFFRRSLDTHGVYREKAYFTYEKRDRRLTRSNQIKSVISEF
jgi:hypothetical protein